MTAPPSPPTTSSTPRRPRPRWRDLRHQRHLPDHELARRRRARLTSWAPPTSPPASTKVDDHTVTFTLAAPNAVWLRNLADPAYTIMPKHILEGMDRRRAEGERLRQRHAAPSAPGPYKLVTFTPERRHRVRGERRLPQGRAEHPQDHLQAQRGPADTAAAQLQSGELHMAFDLVPSDFDVLDGVEGINVERVPGVGQSRPPVPIDQPAGRGPARPPGDRLRVRPQDAARDGVPGRRQAALGAGRFDLRRPRARPVRVRPGEGQGAHRGGRGRRHVRPDQPASDHLLPRGAGLERDRRGARERPDQCGHPHRAGALRRGRAGRPSCPNVNDYEISLQCCGSSCPPGHALGRVQLRDARRTQYANCDLDAAVRATPGRPAMRPSRPRSTRRSRQILNKDVPYDWLWAVANTHANIDGASATSRTTRTRASRSRRSRSGRWRRSRRAPAPLILTDGVVIGPSRGTLTLLSEEPMG